MEIEEIKAKFQARQLESQIEFDRVMNELNTEQTHLNHPYLDRMRDIEKKINLLKVEKRSIDIQIDTLKIERVELEQKAKDINRVFHELKHELIMMNPREGYAKPEENG